MISSPPCGANSASRNWWNWQPPSRGKITAPASIVRSESGRKVSPKAHSVLYRNREVRSCRAQYGSPVGGNAVIDSRHLPARPRCPEFREGLGQQKLASGRRTNSPLARTGGNIG